MRKIRDSILVYSLLICIFVATELLQAHAAGSGAFERQALPADPSELTLCAADPKPDVSYGKIRLPAFRQEAFFRSKRPRYSSDITIVTQCSLDRLHMLEVQCRNWGGITSTVVYFPLAHFNPDNEQQLEDARAKLEEFHTRMDSEGEGVCRLDIALISETLKAQDIWAYPYNALRNQALARAQTDVLLLLDIDFVPNAGLFGTLTQPAKFEALHREVVEQRNAIVLVAFETNPKMSVENGTLTAERAFRGNKDNLLAMFTAREVIQFAEFYPAGHKPSNYKLWFSEAGQEPYQIRFKVGYEPYVLIGRKTMPWYDERFRGYGWDKVMQIYHQDAIGMRFLAHPAAWVVHRPHAPSQGYKHTFTGEAYTAKHKPTDHLWKMERIAKDMMAELRAGSYPPQGVSTLAHCRLLETAAQGESKWW